MNTTYKNIKIKVLALAVMGVTLGNSGCLKAVDDKYDEINVTDAVFWRTEAHLIAGANYLYTFLPEIGENNDNNWSDDARSTGSNSISDGSRTVPSSSGDWNNNYALIRAANNVIEKAATMTIDEAIVNRYTAEARFFRALAYTDLLKRFGEVPIVLRTLGIGDELLYGARDSREDVIATIYGDLDFGISNLPKGSVLPNAEYGRITVGAAQALKVRVSLFEGTFNKYHGLGKAVEHLTIARNTANDMINEGYYQLYTYTANAAKSYFYLFQEISNGPSNRETILPRLYGVDMENTISSHNYSRNLEQGSTTPTRSMMDAYLFIDGLPAVGANRSPLFETPVNTLSEFANRDPRMAMTVYKAGDISANGALYSASFHFTQTGYKTLKYVNAVEWEQQRSFTHYKVIRYAEVLLSFAEATYELSGSISDEDLNRSLNLVRRRAGMPDLTNAFVTASGLDMKEEIRRERRVEFALEGGQRYWDIIRWKIAEDVLPGDQLGIRYFAADYAQPLDNPNLTQDGYIIAQTAATRTFDPARDYLWPLPTQELTLNPNLVQNPNWK